MKNESVWGFLTLCLEFYVGDILRGRMAGPAVPERDLCERKAPNIHYIFCRKFKFCCELRAFKKRKDLQKQCFLSQKIINMTFFAKMCKRRALQKLCGIFSSPRKAANQSSATLSRDKRWCGRTGRPWMDSITPCSLLLLSTHVTSATSTSMEPGALDFARFFWYE